MKINGFANTKCAGLAMELSLPAIVTVGILTNLMLTTVLTTGNQPWLGQLLCGYVVYILKLRYSN